MKHLFEVLNKTAPWALTAMALASLPVLAFVVDDDLAQQRRHRCEALRGVDEMKFDERFGSPKRTWDEGSSMQVREYSFGLDWSLMARFEDGVLSSCDVSDS